MWMIYSVCVNFAVIIENIKIVKEQSVITSVCPWRYVNVIYSKISKDDSLS